MTRHDSTDGWAEHIGTILNGGEVSFELKLLGLSGSATVRNLWERRDLDGLGRLRGAHIGYVLQTGEIVLSDNAEKLRKDTSIQKAYLGME